MAPVLPEDDIDIAVEPLPVLSQPLDSVTPTARTPFISAYPSPVTSLVRPPIPRLAYRLCPPSPPTKCLANSPLSASQYLASHPPEVPCLKSRHCCLLTSPLYDLTLPRHQRQLRRQQRHKIVDSRYHESTTTTMLSTATVASTTITYTTLVASATTETPSSYTIRADRLQCQRHPNM